MNTGKKKKTNAARSDLPCAIARIQAISEASNGDDVAALHRCNEMVNGIDQIAERVLSSMDPVEQEAIEGRLQRGAAPPVLHILPAAGPPSREVSVEALIHDRALARVHVDRIRALLGMASDASTARDVQLALDVCLDLLAQVSLHVDSNLPRRVR